MNLDVESLRTFSRLAHSGAERAAASLTGLTGMESYVNVTKVELSTKADVDREFSEWDLVSVRIGFDGGLDGQTVLAFDQRCTDRLVESLLGPEVDEEMATSSLMEVANIMIGGFIDGWANYLGTSIDISTPTYVDLGTDGPLAGLRQLESNGGAANGAVDVDDCEDRADDERVLVFRNELETVDDEIDFHLFMAPTPGSVQTIVEASESDDDAFPLTAFNSFCRMISDGAEQASADLSAMTGIETDVDVSRLGFVPIEGVPMQLADEPRTGVVLEFDGMLSGYIAILFDDASADQIASALMPGMDADAAMRQSAIQEIGNIVTSGFLDGWANALETTIDISPPQFADDLAPAIVDPLATELAQTQEYAFLIDSTIRTTGDEFSCDIYALPDETELRRALNRLSAATV